MYLNWHHGNIREGASGYMFRKYFSVTMRGKEASEESIHECWKGLESSLKRIAKVWLPNGSDKKYMFGPNPSIADLSLAMELLQLEGINFHNEVLKVKYPGIYKWLYTDMMEIDGFKEISKKGR